MKIGIIEVFIVLIFAALAVVSYLLNRWRQESNDRFYIALEGLIEKLDAINGNITISLGYMTKTVNELSDFRRDFGLTLNKELANKVQAILDAGEKPENMMKKIDPKTGKEIWETIDHGW